MRCIPSQVLSDILVCLAVKFHTSLLRKLHQRSELDSRPTDSVTYKSAKVEIKYAYLSIEV